MMSPNRSAIATAMSDGLPPAFASATISSISWTSSISVALNLTSRSATSAGRAGFSWAGSLYIAFIAAMRPAKVLFIALSNGESINVYVGGLDDLAPFHDFILNKASEVRRLAAARFGGIMHEALAHVRA